MHTYKPYIYIVAFVHIQPSCEKIEYLHGNIGKITEKEICI